jgi:flagellin-like hook-associated protein FlgL
MARINSNIPSLIAQANLKRANADLDIRLERLSTGLRVNRGKDDPAGLIISERLRSEIQGAEQGIKNAERASSVIATTEAALAEVNDLLNGIQSLMVEAANTGANSLEEREANQLAIDSAIDSITRISNTASFGGLKLLNGSLDYVLSGVDQGAIDKARINNATFTQNQAVSVEVDILASAQKGSLFLPGVQPGATNGTLMSSMTVRLAGPEGVQEVSFVSGTTFADVVTAVNRLTAFTGVEAALVEPGNASSGLVFRSGDYGSESFVAVERTDRPQTAGVDQFNLFKFDPGTAFGDWDDGAVDFPWGAVATGGAPTPPLRAGAVRDVGQDVSGAGQRQPRQGARARPVGQARQRDSASTCCSTRASRSTRPRRSPPSISPAAARCSRSGRRSTPSSRPTSASSRCRPRSSAARWSTARSSTSAR